MLNFFPGLKSVLFAILSFAERAREFIDISLAVGFTAFRVTFSKLDWNIIVVRYISTC